MLIIEISTFDLSRELDNVKLCLDNLSTEKEEVFNQLEMVLREHENCEGSIKGLEAKVEDRDETIHNMLTELGTLREQVSKNTEFEGKCQRLETEKKYLSGQLQAKELALLSLQTTTTKSSVVKLGNESRRDPRNRPDQDVELNEPAGESQKGSESSPQSERQTEEVPSNLESLSTSSALQEQQSVTNVVLQRVEAESVVAASQDTAETNDQPTMSQQLMSNRALQSGEAPNSTDELDSELAGHIGKGCQMSRHDIC